MPALVLAVVAIAIPDALNPTLIAGAVYLALGGEAGGAFKRTLAFTLAAFAVTLAAGLAIALGLGEVILSLLPKLSSTVKWKVLTVVGALLMCGGVAIWWRRDSLASDPPSASREPGHTGSPVLMGAGIAGLELPTAFPYFAAIATILGASVAFSGKAFLLLLYNVIYISPLIAIVIACAVMGDRAGRVVAPIGDWIATRWPFVVAPLTEAAGIALTAYGILQLS
jgi:cytochrome c biogenesis protein CcdA